MKLESPVNTVVGKFYQVPCLVYPEWVQIAGCGEYVPFIPVQLPAHTDLDLGVSQAHYHIDWRFVHKGSYDYVFEYHGRALMGQVVGAVTDGQTIEMRKAKCKREMPVFTAQSNVFFCNFQSQYLEHCIDPLIPVCPHRGVDLQTAPIEIIGGKAVLVCPGHGLGWDKETGENVIRHFPKE